MAQRVALGLSIVNHVVEFQPGQRSGSATPRLILLDPSEASTVAEPLLWPL
jgi:hypothetical protein